MQAVAGACGSSWCVRQKLVAAVVADLLLGSGVSRCNGGGQAHPPHEHPYAMRYLLAGRALCAASGMGRPRATELACGGEQAAELPSCYLMLLPPTIACGAHGLGAFHGYMEGWLAACSTPLTRLSACMGHWLAASSTCCSVGTAPHPPRAQPSSAAKALHAAPGILTQARSGSTQSVARALGIYTYILGCSLPAGVQPLCASKGWLRLVPCLGRRGPSAPPCIGSL